MKAFNIGARKTNLSKKELEKQRMLEEKKAEAAVLQQFVETFEKPASGIKTFVKGATINGPPGEQQNSKQIYKPAKLQELEEKAKKELCGKTFTSNLPVKMEKPPKKKKDEKPKSNLELFKEELKIIQEEREGRLKTRYNRRESEDKERFKKEAKEHSSSHQNSKHTSENSNKSDSKVQFFGSYDTGDPNTTNIYLGNINPKTTEQDLMKVFGKYGPLASVKIMWPRTDEERARNRNCGFVAFMNRKDAERAMKYLLGKEIMGYDMKLGWGKTVPIPVNPVYIPPKLLELTMPPPFSGLPFNAQPDPKDVELLPPPRTPLSVLSKMENFNEVLKNSVVKVVTPIDRSLLCLIHRMVEFVVREGPMFEAMIMNREISNPMFKFLFENQSPEHIYYRWRLFSVLQGEHHSKWRVESFRMFKDGPIWKPPPLCPYLQGMPEELIDFSPKRDVEIEEDNVSPIHNNNTSNNQRGFKESKEKDIKKGMLTDKERESFEDILRNLTPERQKIQEAMIYCIEHAEAAEEIIECIVESLSISETPLHKKISRLYLISDVFHNCTVKVTNASYYRKGFQSKLINIFSNLGNCYKSIEGRLKAEHFKQRVMNCFKAWEDWAFYSSDFLINLQNIFLGLVNVDEEKKNILKSEEEPADIDGIPLEIDTEIDGIPMENEDLDGIPLDDDQSANIKFKLSKWETIDPNIVVKQAVTSSKWEKIENQNEDENDNDIDGIPIELNEKKINLNLDNSRTIFHTFEQLKQKLNLNPEERRIKLREIELRVIKYQDNLENGKEARKLNLTISEQAMEYRIKLIKKCINNLKQNDHHDHDNKNNKHSPRPTSRSPRSPKSSRSSSNRKRSRSRSPYRSYKKNSPERSTRNKSRSPISKRKSSNKSPTFSHKSKKR